MDVPYSRLPCSNGWLGPSSSTGQLLLLADSNRTFEVGTERYLASVAESIPRVVLMNRAALFSDRKLALFYNRDLDSLDTHVVR